MDAQTDNQGYRYQEVERRILSLIDSGGLKRGERLPSLRGLSAKMGLSVSTVNQAYIELERKGIIESRPRSGFFVRQRSRRLPRTQAREARMDKPRPVTRTGLIQTVLESVGRADAVPLGVIAPDPELMPLKELARITGAVVREHPRRALGYAPIPGDPELRQQIAFRAMEQGLDVSPEDPIITAGCVEGLHMALRATTKPGDTVLVQAPTYYCFLQLLETLGLKAIEVPSDPEHGVDPADLAWALDRFDIRACVLAPNFNNPDASLTPDEAKAEIVELLARKDVPLVEDDVYTDLHFGTKRPCTYKQFDRAGRVLLCSSFSKTLAPGFRIGWMLPGRYATKILEIKATTNVSTAAPAQMAVAEYLRQGRMDRHLRRLRAAIEGQMDTMQVHLTKHFPRSRVTHPTGGCVLWVEMPETVDGVELFFQARERSIGIAPGAIFSTRDKFANFIRLSCGAPWSEAIDNGLAELGRLAGEMA